MLLALFSAQTTSENTDSVFSDASSRILGIEVLADRVNVALDFYPKNQFF